MRNTLFSTPRCVNNMHLALFFLPKISTVSASSPPAIFLAQSALIRQQRNLPREEAQSPYFHRSYDRKNPPRNRECRGSLLMKTTQVSECRFHDDLHTTISKLSSLAMQCFCHTSKKSLCVILYPIANSAQMGGNKLLQLLATIIAR